MIENGWVWSKDKSSVYYAPISLQGEYTLPESLTYIGDNTFWNCDDLTGLTLLAKNPPVFSNNAFESLFYENALLTIPTGSLFDYCNTDWYKFRNIKEDGSSGNAIRYCENDLNYVCSLISNEAMLVKGHYSWLDNVAIPNRISVENGGESSFYDVTEIGNAAFKDCSLLESFTLSNNISKIDYEAFSGCSGLSSLVLPDNLNSIGALAFIGTGLHSINIPEGVKSIGMSAFQDCSSLESVNFDENVKDLIIESSAFQNSGLISITLPDGVAGINESVFRNSAKLNNVIIGKGITEIPDNAFMGCINLDDIVFSENVSLIKEQAFRSTAFKSINISNSISFIGKNAFADCKKLKSFSIEDGLIEIELGKDILNDSSVETMHVGRSFFSTPFNSLSSLCCLSIGNTVTSVPDSAFWGCSKLRTLKLGSCIEIIGSSAFKDCTIENIVIPPSVKSIADNAFASNNSKSISIGFGIKAIGEKAFYENNDIDNIYITAEHSPSAYGNTFSYYDIPLWLINQKAMDDYSNNPSCWYRFENNMRSLIGISNLTSKKRNIYGLPGDTVKLEVNVVPVNATLTDIFWRSTRPDLISVDNDGLVTFLVSHEEFNDNNKSGNPVCQIIASTMYEDVPYLIYNVYIGKEVYPEVVNISETELSIIIGESVNLHASVLPEDATDKTIIWTTSDEDIATVDESGKVTAKGIGKAEIMASCGDVTASCMVTVNPILAESLTITPDIWRGEKGSNFLISAEILPDDTTDKSLSWESSDPSIASVDNLGNVTVLKEGSCVISVSTLDGSNLKAECYITGISGIDLIFADEDAKVEVYDLNGVLLRHNCTRDELKQLRPACYLIRSNDKTITVYINSMY